MFHRPSADRPGWVAFALMGERACAAHVVDAGGDRPAVHWIEHPQWGDTQVGLAGLVRSRGLQRHALLGVLRRGDYQFSQMEAPDLPREEWRDALRWRLQELADFPMDSASIDLLEIPAQFYPRGKPPVIAIAAPQAPLAALVRGARHQGVRWQAFDVVECALRNLSARCEPSQRAQALLHVDAERSTLVITAGGELLLSRSIDVTLAALRPDPEDSGKLEAFQAAADRVGLEMQRTFDSFERQFGELMIARVLLAPTGLEAFARHIAELVYTPVEPLDLSSLFDLAGLPPEQAEALSDPARQADALVALGAALRPAPVP